MRKNTGGNSMLKTVHLRTSYPAVQEELLNRGIRKRRSTEEEEEEEEELQMEEEEASCVSVSRGEERPPC